MSAEKSTPQAPTQFELDKMLVEERKVRALEKIAVSLDALTVWFEEIDKDGWDERLQFYLAEWKKSMDIK